MLSDDHTDSAFGVDDSGNSVRVQDDVRLSDEKQQEFNEDYDASDKVRKDTKLTGTKGYSDITPHILVRALAECEDFSSSLDNLLKNRKLRPSCIRDIAVTYPYVFYLKGENVELKPEIRFCEAHCGPLGCRKCKSCNDLHICHGYMKGDCHDNECIFGHKWNTDHNLHILSHIFLDILPSEILIKLLKKGSTKILPDVIDICHDYNGEGCDDSDCDFLHICHRFIVSVAKGNFSACMHECLLNHSFQSTNCISLLEKYSMPTNEAPRDIVLLLMSVNPALCSEEIKKTCSPNITSDNDDLPIDDFPIDDFTCMYDLSNLYEKRGYKRKLCLLNNRLFTDAIALCPPNWTVWSHHLKGNVPVLEICYVSTVEQCPYEKSGCQRLHSKLHYHWQVSEDNILWLNLMPAHVKCLEAAFCDPGTDIVFHPPSPFVSNIALSDDFFQTGSENWFSEFSSMTLNNSSKTKELYIRRLCTENTGMKIAASSYVWYVLEENGIWVQFGEKNDQESNSLTGNVTSEQLEVLFLQNPHGEVSFSSMNFTLIFQEMLLKNHTTERFHIIMRRPLPHLKELSKAWKERLLMPHVQHFGLPMISTEYKEITKLVQESFQSKIIKIERTENPFLERAFQNNVDKMVATYGSIAKVDIRYLFHGTSFANVKKICEENFDWRLYGTQHGRNFGCGTYFATNASISVRYSKPDTKGHHYVFVAQVAVGSKELGKFDIKVPSINPVTSLPYNSTVDNLSNPKIIVKYDKQEYYPKYLITLSGLAKPL